MGLNRETQLTEAILRNWWKDAPPSVLRGTPALAAAQLARIASETALTGSVVVHANDEMRAALDDLWGRIHPADIAALTPETQELARLNREILWHSRVAAE